MREQVITPRAGRAASASKGRSGEIVQKPARRDRGGSSMSRARAGGSLRKALVYMPLVGKIMLAVIAGVLVFAGYRAAASASFFQIRTVDVSGTSRASADEIKRVVRVAAQQTGVWRADISTLSRELERLPWVRRAIISRVLPDGLRVRVTEREPRAVVRTSSGKLIWVDDDAVTLGQMSPTDRMPAFFIRGWDEGGTEAAQAENRERIQKYLLMLKEWGQAGLGERVSEVNLIDTRDVRVQLAGDDSQVEVRLGGQDFGQRLQSALKVLDEQRGTPRGALITRLDATLDKRVIVGFSSGLPVSSESTDSGSESADVVKTRMNAGDSAGNERAATRSKKEIKESKRKETDQAKKERDKEREKKDQKSNDSKPQTRLRRVG